MTKTNSENIAAIVEGIEEIEVRYVYVQNIF